MKHDSDHLAVAQSGSAKCPETVALAAPARKPRQTERAPAIGFDGPGFIEAVQSAAKEFGLKCTADIARDSGITDSSISRMKLGIGEPLVATVAVLGALYGVNPCRFVTLKDGSRG